MKPRRKTRPGRLRVLDQALSLLDGALLTRSDGDWAGAPVVDFGVGQHPFTTMEWAAALSRLDPAPPVIGVDIDLDVISHAQKAADRAGVAVRFVRGSFDAPVSGARLLRALNVLRDYPPESAFDLRATLGRSLRSGGLLVEGSCGPDGAVGTVLRLRRTPDGLVDDGLLVWTDFSQGFSPRMFLDRLPTDLRRTARGDHPLARCLRSWTARVDARRPSRPWNGPETMTATAELEGFEVVAPGIVRLPPLT